MIDNLKNQILEITEILKINNHKKVASTLIKELKNIENENKKIIGLENIISMCHIKDLGDLYISTTPYEEWLKKLNNLEKKTKRILKKLEINSE